VSFYTYCKHVLHAYRTREWPYFKI